MPALLLLLPCQAQRAGLRGNCCSCSPGCSRARSHVPSCPLSLLPRLRNELRIDACCATPASLGILVFLFGLSFAAAGLREDDRAELAAEVCKATLASHVRVKSGGLFRGYTALLSWGATAGARLGIEIPLELLPSSFLQGSG